MEKVVLGDLIRDQNGDIVYFNLLNNFKIGITLFAAFMLSLFGILLVSFLIKQLTHRIRFGERRTRELRKQIVSAVSSFGVRRLSAIGVFVLFVHLFFWIIQLFLTNNIKTNKVVRPFLK